MGFDIHHGYLTAKQTVSLAVCVTERVVYLPRLSYLFNKLGVFLSLVLLQIFFFLFMLQMHVLC